MTEILVNISIPYSSQLFRSDLVAPATVAQVCENKNRYANIFACKLL